jgi:hypothetical protein
LGRENLDGAAAAHVSNHPNHLGVQNGDLASFGQTLGYHLVRATWIQVRLAGLSKKVHGHEERKRNIRQQVEGNRDWSRLAAWR